MVPCITAMGSVKGLPECREYGTIAVVKVSRDIDLTNGG